MQARLRQAVFQVEPLRNIVGTGGTAYHIVVDRGAALGILGVINVPAYAEISNDSEFKDSANECGSSRPASWFRRALATLKH